MFNKIILKNGLRIITVPMRGTKAVTVLVLVGAGSKYETKRINGISHFSEHMFFKGTKKRPTTLDIAETLDKVGGAYNAFTSKEFTGYWAKVSSENYNLALDWVSDILMNSKFDQEEINRERGVILEELNMYLDTPMKYVEDLWEILLYGGQPAGWTVLGEKENILRFKRKDFIDYLNKHYSAKNTVVVIAGNFDEKKAVENVKDYFKKISKNIPQGKKTVIEKQVKPQVLIKYKKTDQTHLCLGVRAYSLFHPDRYALDLLSIILGGNMSSRLFISIRERRGLAYYIHSSVENYTDTGYLMVQAGIPHKHISEVVKLTLKEFKRAKESKIPARELQKAKDYLKGSSILSLESSDNTALFYAGQELLTKKTLTPKEKFKEIDKVTPEQIQKVANDIFKNNKLNLAMISPFKGKEKIQKMLNI